MKKARRILSAAMILCMVCMMGLPVFAGSANVVGFPLPAKSTPYNVNVLARYSGGGAHMPYLYEWGPLKGKKVDYNIVMDIGVGVGHEVYAVADGTVRTVAYGDGGGHYIVIDHKGTYSYYGHLREKPLVKKGKTVKAGQLIGYSGNTGNSQGPHLHFEWSGHDPYCLFESKGLVKIGNPKSGAGVYPHTHANPYKKPVKCTHSYNGGICRYCGYEYAYKVTEMKATALKVSKKGGAPVWSRPYSNNSTKKGTAVEKGIVVAKGKTVNREGNTWYLLSDNTWIYSGNVKVCSMPGNVRYVSSADGLNLRAKAAVSGKLLCTIPNGGAVVIKPSRTSGSWVYANYPEKGISGWLSSKYLTKAVR